VIILEKPTVLRDEIATQEGLPKRAWEIATCPQIFEETLKTLSSQQFYRLA
tara:strand:+ start:275 stop:427 length:153 start_codon:yes stop_codon:yes gene_type:complete